MTDLPPRMAAAAEQDTIATGRVPSHKRANYGDLLTTSARVMSDAVRINDRPDPAMRAGSAARTGAAPT
jgi:hypothetical protein